MCYRNATTDQPEIAGKSFFIRSVPGLDLYGNVASSDASVENMFLMTIDSSKKQITVIKKVMIPFW